jgi:hypothetical protein
LFEFLLFFTKRTADLYGDMVVAAVVDSRIER